MSPLIQTSPAAAAMITLMGDTRNLMVYSSVNQPTNTASVTRKKYTSSSVPLRFSLWGSKYFWDDQEYFSFLFLFQGLNF